MRHPQRVEDCLRHIAEAIDRARSHVQPLPGIEAFEKNPQVQDAVVRNIEIIGEAVNHINRMAPSSLRSIRNFRGTTCATCATSSFTPTLPRTYKLSGAPGEFAEAEAADQSIAQRAAPRAGTRTPLPMKAPVRADGGGDYPANADAP
jgi:hypothetical protein